MQKGNDINRVAFGKRLNAVRKEKKITSEQLSEMCGISAIHILQIECGTKLPSLTMLVKLCNQLKVPPTIFWQTA